MDKAAFTALAESMGVSRVCFAKPEQYKPDTSAVSKSLCWDPFALLPGARCLIGLLLHYAPYEGRKERQLPISAFYVASNALYHLSKDLERVLSDAGYQAIRAELPAKTALMQAGLGGMGRNSLVSVPVFGTRFAVQWLVADAFEPDAPDMAGLKKATCTQCGRCQRACPVQAIGENGLNPKKCMRFFMNTAPMPEYVKARFPSLFGCELCQKACLRNRDAAHVPMPEELAQLFTFERIFARRQEDKRRFRAAVGKNMLSGGRLRAQALILAERMERPEAGTYARAVLQDADSTENERDAALWVLGRIDS